MNRKTPNPFYSPTTISYTIFSRVLSQKQNKWFSLGQCHNMFPGKELFNSLSQVNLAF